MSLGSKYWNPDIGGKSFTAYDALLLGTTKRLPPRMQIMFHDEKPSLSRDHYRRLFDESLQGIAILSGGRIILANEAYAETLGRPLEELKRMSSDQVWTLIHPDDKFELQKRDELIHRAKILPKHRFRYIRPNGEIRWVESYVRIVEYDGLPALQALEVDITEQVHAEQALRESEERFRTFIEGSEHGYIVFQGNPAKVIYSNPSLTRIIGYSNQDLMSMTMEDIMSGIDENFREDAGSYLTMALEKGTKLDMTNEFHFSRKDGTKVWLRTDSSLIYLNNELALQMLVLDITRQKELDEALQKGERSFRGIFEASPIGILLFNIEGRIIQINKAAKDILGVDTEDDYKNYRIANDPNIPSRVLQDIQVGMGDSFEGPYDIEKAGFRTTRKAPLHILVHALPLDIDEEGRITQYLVHIQDITERVKTQEILKKSEEKYRTLFESANDAIFLMKDDMFVECNERALEMFDCSRDQILESTPYRFSPPFQQDGRTSKESAIEKIEATLNGIPQAFEWKHSRCNGTSFDAEVSLNAIQLGDETFILAIVRDVTHRKELEQKTKSASRRGMLFLDLLTHDIKNKLQALELFTGLIEESGAVDKEILEQICSSLTDCTHLISKVETTKTLPTLPLATQSLQDVLLRSITKISSEYDDVEIILPTITIGKGNVLVDTYIDMVFYELIENAIKHNKNSNRKIWILVDEDEINYNVSVADNGQGLSPSFKDEIFNPEKRVGGVGLHLVYEILEKYNGSVRVLDRIEGQSSMGSMFVVSIPKFSNSHETS